MNANAIRKIVSTSAGLLAAAMLLAIPARSQEKPMNAVVELRQYSLRPGQRDTLVTLFERAFVESQEADGMDVIGTFRDLDQPDHFVWLRGFPDMDSRKSSLAAFYGGPVWKANGKAANATMVDTDNVLLLKPAWDGSGFVEGSRAPVGATALPSGVVKATIYYFDRAVPASFVSAFRAHAVARLGHRFLAALITNASPNTFPSLPVREGENVFICFTHDDDDADATPAPAESGNAIVKTEVLRLKPTPRSKVR